MWSAVEHLAGLDVRRLTAGCVEGLESLAGGMQAVLLQ
jgi:hypothetical protein